MQETNTVANTIKQEPTNDEVREIAINLANTTNSKKDNDLITYVPYYDNNDDEYIISLIGKGIENAYKNKNIDDIRDTVENEMMDNLFLNNREEIDSFIDDLSDETLKKIKIKYPKTQIQAKDISSLLGEITYVDLSKILKNIDVPFLVTLKPELGPKYDTIFLENENFARTDDANSAYYLTLKQGYTKKDFINLIESSQIDNHLQSMREEFYNRSSESNYLTFLLKFPYNELVDLYKNRDKGVGNITIPKNTTCGFYDPWNGGGSLMNISLAQDFSLPLENVHSIRPDGALGYSLKEIYGENFDYTNSKITNKPLAIAKMELQSNSFNDTNSPLIIKQINKEMADKLENNTSILLKEREGVDYSINSRTGKPFSSINQILLQQRRADQNYKNPNFYDYKGDVNCQLKRTPTGYIICEYNPKTNNLIYNAYYNHEQMTLFPTNYEPVKFDIPMPVVTYNPESPVDNFRRDINNYLTSLYNGEKYKPSDEIIKNRTMLSKMLRDNSFSIIQFASYAQDRIDENINKTKNEDNIKTSKHFRKR